MVSRISPGGLVASFFVLVFGCALVLVGGGRAADNPIVVENQQPGSDLWRVTRGADDIGQQIKGYAGATSVNKGGSITFFVTVNPVQTYTIDVFRMGWYQGKGGRLLQHIGPLGGVRQPACPLDVSTGLIECNWSPSYTLAVPTSWTSGIYLALLTNSQGYQSYINFVVRDDAHTGGLLYQESVTTYQAYNNYPNDFATGKSLYPYDSFGANTASGGPRAVKVSFDRPYADKKNWGAGDFLNWEVYFVRWLERSGYDVSYSTDLDTHTDGQRLLSHKGFLSVGHDEYWSRAMYDAAEAARDSGVSLAFFGANAVYWQIRFEPSPATGAANRVIVCYKSGTLDPVKGPTTTDTWRSSLLNRPEQRLAGVQFVTAIDTTRQPHEPYVVLNSTHWVYSGTGFHDGDSVPGLVGYEMDQSMSSYALPVAANNSYTLLSRSPFTNFLGTATWANSSIYQAPSGAWVFGAGTVAWSWGLDKTGVSDPRIQQTTTNILNRFLEQQQPILSAPVNTSPPTISGTPVVGQSLTATTGTWSGSPTSYAYQWRRCATNGYNCASVVGANANSYLLSSADVGYTIRVNVFARNTAGTTWQNSAATAIVRAQ